MFMVLKADEWNRMGKVNMDSDNSVEKESSNLPNAVVEALSDFIGKPNTLRTKNVMMQFFEGALMEWDSQGIEQTKTKVEVAISYEIDTYNAVWAIGREYRWLCYQAMSRSEAERYVREASTRLDVIVVEE